MTYLIHITDGEKDLAFDAFKVSGADVCGETFLRAILAAGLRDLLKMRPSDARLAVADAVAFLRKVED